MNNVQNETKTPETPQERMRRALAATGLPYRELRVYGSQIMVTCASREAANRWHSLLHKFCSTVHPVGESVDYCKVNKGTCLLPSTIRVWRTWATV